MKVSYSTSFTYCDSIGGKPVQVRNTNVLKAIQNLPGYDENMIIWQEIKYEKHRIMFVTTNLIVPPVLDGKQTAVDVENYQDHCGAYEIHSNKFLFAPCGVNHSVVCEMKMSAAQLFTMFLETNNVNFAAHALREEIDSFLGTFQSLPQGVEPPNSVNLKLFTMFEQNVILNFGKVAEYTFTELASEFTEFFQIEQSKMKALNSGLKDTTLLKLTMDECCDNLFDAIFENSENVSTLVLQDPQKVDNALLLSISELKYCESWSTFTLLPLHNRNGSTLSGTFTKSSTDTCKTLPPKCLKSNCTKSSLVDNVCCEMALQGKMNHTCSENSSADYAIKNATHVFVNSATIVNLTWTCQTFSIELHTFLATISDKNDCHIISSDKRLPWFSNVFLVNDNYEFKEVLPDVNEQVGDNSMLNKILTYAAFLASVCTILMFIFSLYLFYQGRKTNARQRIQNNIRNQENLEIEMEENKTLQSTQTRQSPRFQKSILKRKNSGSRRSSTDSDPGSE